MYVNVLAVRGGIAANKSEYVSARSYFDRSLSMARALNDPWEAVQALTNIGSILRMQGDYHSARSQLEVALKLDQQLGRSTWMASELCALAENEIAQGGFAAARLYLQEALASSEASGNRWLQVIVGYVDGQLSYYEGDNSRAVALLEKAAVLARESEYRPDLAQALVTLGRALHAGGDTQKAAASLTEGLRLFWESGNKLGVATALEGLAELMASNASGRAALLCGAAEAIRSAIGAPLPPVDQPAYERNLALTRARLGVAEFEAAAARGRSEPFPATMATILESFNFTN